jgi:hypothetical protein
MFPNLGLSNAEGRQDFSLLSVSPFVITKAAAMRMPRHAHRATQHVFYEWPLGV